MSGRIAIVGAGWLGAEVARRAADSGRAVIATTRSGQWRRATPPDVPIRAFDLLEEGDEALARLLEGCAAAVFALTPSGGQDREALYVGGARRIARVCRELPLGRVVYTSSTSALASVDGPVDETSTEWPESGRGRIQREAEEALREGFAHSTTPWTILRLAGLYGPERPLRRIYRVDDVDRVRPGDGHQCTNLVHLDDAAAAVSAALRLPSEQTGVIHVCDDDHRTRRDVAAAVAEAHGCPPPKWEEREADGPPRGKQVQNDEMKRTLGVQLRHPSHAIGSE